MANVLNRATREYRVSVNDPDFPIVDWIHNPDLSVVAGQPNKYWVITGDVVTLMDQASRDAVDAAELVARRDGVAADMDNVENIVRAFMGVVLVEFNNHATRTNDILTAIDNATNLGGLKTAIAALPDLPIRVFGDLRTALRNRLGT